MKWRHDGDGVGIGKGCEKTRILNTYLAIDELDVMRALGIAIASPELRAGLIAGILRHPSVFVHRYEIERPVQATGKVRYVHREGKLLHKRLLLHLNPIPLPTWLRSLYIMYFVSLAIM
jgi:hypothetical protein